MRLVIARTLWGLEEDPACYHQHLAAIAAAGYDAVVCPVQPLEDVEAFGRALADSGLGYVAQAFTFGRTVEEHLESFDSAVRGAAALDPVHVVAQAGRDGWSLDDSLRFLRRALDLAEAAGVRVAHETHRGRILFTPWVTEQVLARLPALPLALDLSHWTCVGESMRLPARIVELAAANAVHVDARVGHEEGPQVPDPRVERYAGHLEAFEGWWDTVWRVQEASGAGSLVLAPEFGPPPYQPIEPHTGRPLADVNELNDWMAQRLRHRYGP